MLTAVSLGRLRLERVIELMHSNPRRIYGMPEQADTWVEMDMDARYTFPDHELYNQVRLVAVQRDGNAGPYPACGFARD